MELSLRRGARVAPLLVLTAGMLVAAPRSARAVEQPEVLRLRAETLARAGRCEEALPLLERARRVAPQDAHVLHVAGQCQMRLRRFTEAQALLEQAERLDPGLADVALHLGIARFHAGDLEGAERALARARERTPDRAEVDLYEGLIQLQRAQASEAAAALEQARRRDPLAVDPIASYYAGLAWQSAAEEQRAREALERVRREAPGSPWADAAERALASLSAVRGIADRRDLRARQQAERPLGTLAPALPTAAWARLSAGVEYDDNVVLRGSGVELPADISNEGDARLVWTADVGAELFTAGEWSFGALAAYYGTLQEDLEDYNVQYPTLTLWGDRPLGEATTARLQYDFGYAWVGADPFLVAHTFTPALFRSWGSRGTTRLFAEFTWSNFLFRNTDVPDGDGSPACPPPLTLCGPPGLNEARALNRDGFGSIIGVDHVIPIAAAKSELRGGYRFHRYSSRGSEYSYQGHEVSLGVRSQLPLDVILDVDGSYLYKPNRNPSVFPDPDTLVFAQQYALSNVRRRENVWRLDVILERALTDRIIASVRYSYLDNDSNTQVYDYTRNVVGAYLTYQFQR